MNVDIKKKWIAALLSGKYKQGRDVLRNSKNEFCCFGVLCDVVDNTKWEESSRGYYYDLCFKLLPLEIRNKYGIREIDYLTMMNDSGVSFKEIAKYIKENV